LVLEIALIVAALLVLAMAKRRRARRNRRDFAVMKFDAVIPMSTAADNAILTQALQTLAQDFDVKSIDVMVSLTDLTAGEGPIEVGWAQSVLTGTQILECLDAQPTSQLDVTANEQQKRRVRAFGLLSEANGELNEGRPFRSRMSLHCPNGVALADVWAVNRGGAQLTTGAQLHFHGNLYGHWKT